MCRRRRRRALRKPFSDIVSLAERTNSRMPYNNSGSTRRRNRLSKSTRKRILFRRHFFPRRICSRINNDLTVAISIRASIYICHACAQYTSIYYDLTARRFGQSLPSPGVIIIDAFNSSERRLPPPTRSSCPLYVSGTDYHKLINMFDCTRPRVACAFARRVRYYVVWYGARVPARPVRGGFPFELTRVRGTHTIYIMRCTKTDARPTFVPKRI